MNSLQVFWKNTPKDAKRLWKIGAFILVGGYTAKQIIWEMVQENVKTTTKATHDDAVAHYEKALSDGRRLAYMRREKILDIRRKNGLEGSEMLLKQARVDNFDRPPTKIKHEE